MAMRLQVPAILLAGLLAIGAAVGQFSQTVIFTFANGATAVNSVIFNISFPSNVEPVNLTSKMVWNAGARNLAVDIGYVASNQLLSVPVEISGNPGTYTLTGRLTGTWDGNSGRFESDPVIVEVRIGTIITVELQPAPALIRIARAAVPIVTVVGIAGAAAVAASAASANASVAANLAELFRFAGFGLFRLRKSKPWGRVHNPLTNKPIPGAAVRVFESTFQKLKDTQFTDKEGRFGFLISTGTYYVTVSKPGFQDFKTEIMIIKGEEDVLNLNIPLISETGVSQRVKPLLELFSKVLRFVNRLNPTILILGTLASIAIVYLLPSTLNFALLGLYLVIDSLKVYLARQIVKPYGQTIDKRTGQPLALAVVRIFDADKNWLLNSQATDVSGRFKFLVVPGNYYITCAREGYQAYVSQPIAVTKASAVTWDITLEPAA